MGASTKPQGNQNMFFISGITGQVGGAAARHLLTQGQQVRALVRDPQKADHWAKQGVGLHQGDLNDPAAVAGALQGVEGAFLMIPPTMTPSPDYRETKAVIASYREALRQAPPPRIVFLSSFGSQQPSGLGNITSTHLLEVAMSDWSFPTAFIRPGSFIENYLYGLPQAFDFFLAPTSRPIPMTATTDIGAQVARLLVGGWNGKKIVEIGSRISPDDLARALGEVLGRPVQARAVPREHWAAALQGMGLPPGSTGPYEEMMDGVNSGWIDFGVAGTESVAGTTTPVQVFGKAKKA